MLHNVPHIIVQLPGDLYTTRPIVTIGYGCIPSLGSPVVSVSKIKYILVFWRMNRTPKIKKTSRFPYKVVNNSSLFSTKKPSLSLVLVMS